MNTCATLERSVLGFEKLRGRFGAPNDLEEFLRHDIRRRASSSEPCVEFRLGFVLLQLEGYVVIGSHGGSRRRSLVSVTLIASSSLSFLALLVLSDRARCPRTMAWRMAVASCMVLRARWESGLRRGRLGGRDFRDGHVGGRGPVVVVVAEAVHPHERIDTPRVLAPLEKVHIDIGESRNRRVEREHAPAAPRTAPEQPPWLAPADQQPAPTQQQPERERAAKKAVTVK